MNGTPIATTNIAAVLLTDGWHRVVQGSFSVCSLGFGAHADPGTPGFCFEEADHGSPYRPTTLAGPLSSILAVRLATSARQARELGHPARRWTPARSAPQAVA